MADDDKDDLDKALDRLIGLRPELEKMAERLGDLNSAYPATKEFLKLKGVSHVRELDAAGRQELAAYLRAELARLTGKAGPTQ